jgi:glycosyltransferase involved in cell wall biosynthesis
MTGTTAAASPGPGRTKRVFVPIDHYLPGFRAGGPVQSVGNLVEALGNEIEFSVATKDRDLGGHEPYPDVDVHSWQRVGKARVRYFAPRHVLRGVYRLTTNRDYDVLYLNSAFSPAFSLFPLLLRRLRLARPPSVIVASRGEFSPGALGLKRVKKHMFLWFARAIRLYHGVLWQASAAPEVGHIADAMGWEVAGADPVAAGLGIVAAPDIALPSNLEPYPREKQSGSARILFLSRISKKKNLATALDLLARVEGDVSFDIFGPIEDPAYWRECQRRIASAPDNLHITYRGEIPHDQVGAVMRDYHLFLLPTLGENFGHVIHEALSSGCPVMVSDQTPWRGLTETGAGWDLPLGDRGPWLDGLASVVKADRTRFEEMTRAAAAFPPRGTDAEAVIAANRELFRLATE